MYIYIYIYIERERDHNQPEAVIVGHENLEKIYAELPKPQGTQNLVTNSFI